MSLEGPVAIINGGGGEGIGIGIAELLAQRVAKLTHAPPPLRQ